MSRIATRARALYLAGALSAEAIENMYEAGKITEEERDWILGEV